MQYIKGKKQHTFSRNLAVQVVLFVQVLRSLPPPYNAGERDFLLWCSYFDIILFLWINHRPERQCQQSSLRLLFIFGLNSY